MEGEVPKEDNDIDMDILVLPNEALACSDRGRTALSQG